MICVSSEGTAGEWLIQLWVVVAGSCLTARTPLT